MPKTEKKETTSNPEKQARVRKRIVKGKTTSELMHRQLSDKDAKITEEEFNNIVLDTGSDSEQPSPEPEVDLEIPENKEAPKNDGKDTSHKHITPWDVVG